MIKGIKMPKCCADCPCFYDFISCQALSDGTDDFSASGFDEYKKRLPNCPLVEVPTPHGRLIDTDRLDAVVLELVKSGSLITRSEYKCIASVLFEFPTIIEAEEADS